jgi:hypothetical protein
MRFISGKLFVLETGHEMIVHHPDGLHIRIADCRADELESALQ